MFLAKIVQIKNFWSAKLVQELDCCLAPTKAIMYFSTIYIPIHWKPQDHPKLQKQDASHNVFVYSFEHVRTTIGIWGCLKRPS